jgi:hypothetical protein
MPPRRPGTVLLKAGWHSQSPNYGDSTRVQMILARSSRPERYRLSPPIAGCHARKDKAHVAQLDSAPDYGSGRWRFESFRARQLRSSYSRAAPTACAAGPGYFVLKKRQGHPPRTEPTSCQAAFSTRRTRKHSPNHAPAGADAAERGYFAFQARGRWFESNPGDHLPVAQRTEHLRSALVPCSAPSGATTHRRMPD